ncbi:MAG: glycosyltransferase [Zestosphaera sp.]
MRISVLVLTHCREWALCYSLDSLAHQKRPPDEVLIVLKPCNDGSEEVISRFKKALPLRVIYQNSSGNVTDAVELGYLNASGDVVLFLDDDAVAHEEWVLRYERLFSEKDDAAGLTGLVYKAFLNNDRLIKSEVPFFIKVQTRSAPHREPLPELRDYCGWISASGFAGEKICNDGVRKSVLLCGANMGLRTSLIKDLHLSALYKGSRKGFWFESVVAYWCVLKGFKTYEVVDKEISPIVWHIEHNDSLTRHRGFWDTFWLHYDRVAMFRRLRRLKAGVSAVRYALALGIALRRATLPRLLATLYGLLHDR